MFFGLLLGFILALMRMSSIWPVRWLARMYISIFPRHPADCPTVHDLLRFAAVRH